MSNLETGNDVHTSSQPDASTDVDSQEFVSQPQDDSQYQDASQHPQDVLSQPQDVLSQPDAINVSNSTTALAVWCDPNATFKARFDSIFDFLAEEVRKKDRVLDELKKLSHTADEIFQRAKRLRLDRPSAEAYSSTESSSETEDSTDKDDDHEDISPTLANRMMKRMFLAHRPGRPLNELLRDSDSTDNEGPQDVTQQHPTLVKFMKKKKFYLSPRLLKKTFINAFFGCGCELKEEWNTIEKISEIVSVSRINKIFVTWEIRTTDQLLISHLINFYREKGEEWFHTLKLLPSRVLITNY